MEKYSLLRQRVLADEGTPPGSLRVPAPATDEELCRVHTTDWVERVTTGALTRDEIRRIGFPWSPGLVERSRRSVGGTLAAARAALDGDGVSVSLAGGTHHAFPDRGEGFCVFNDVAVAARAVQADGLAERVAIVDLDVHQGNGTASIFHGDASVFTLSVHGEGNYPFQKETSDLDVELADRTGDLDYLRAVRSGVAAALERSRPELVLYVSGADPHEHDRLGRLAVTLEGLRKRDEMVLRASREAGAAVAVVMSGGYGSSVHDTVSVHLSTVRTAIHHATA